MFKIRKAKDNDDLVGAYTVREEVYALERKWVDPSPNGLEIDLHDPLSTSFVAALSDGTIVATARMIPKVPPTIELPFEKFLALPCPEGKYYEVSRLAVLAEHRSHNSVLLIGICRAMWRRANRLGFTHWVAVVDRPVARLLSTLGFCFVAKGEAAMYMGSESVPVVCCMKQSYDVLFSEKLNKVLEEKIEEVFSHDE